MNRFVTTRYSIQVLVFFFVVIGTATRCSVTSHPLGLNKARCLYSRAVSRTWSFEDFGTQHILIHEIMERLKTLRQNLIRVHLLWGSPPFGASWRHPCLHLFLSNLDNIVPKVNRVRQSTKLSSHYFSKSTNVLTGLMAECCTDNQILTNCCVNTIGNFQYTRS